MKENAKKKYKFLRIIGRIIISIVLLLILLVLFVRSSWGQQYIINKASTYVANKTNTKVALEKFYLTFDGNLLIEGLHLNDTKGDTLVYSKSLEADLALWPLITGQSIGVDAIDWNGLRANVYREDSLSAYNFQFLIDAFASDEQAAPVDTSATDLKIALGGISLNNFNIDFNDKVLGIESKMVLGNINLDVDEIDMEQMNFHTSLFRIAHSNIKFHQKAVATNENEVLESTDEGNDDILPKLVVDAIEFNELTLDYASQADSLSAQLYLADFLLEIPKIDLNTNTISIGELALSQSEIAIKSTKQPQTVPQEELNDTTTTKTSFEWPAYTVKLKKINLEENSIRYSVANAKTKLGVFNPNAIAIDDFTLDVNDIYLENHTTGLQLNKLLFKEASGIDLKGFALDLAVTDQQLSVKNIDVLLNGNKLNADLLVAYPSISKVISTPEVSKLDILLSHYQIDLNQLLELQPSLKEFKALAILAEKELYGKANINGNLSAIDISNFELNWGANTSIITKGSVENFSDPAELTFDFETIEANTVRNDLLFFANEDSLGLRFPKTVQLAVQASGKTDDLLTQLALKTSQGNLFVKANYKNTDRIAYNLALQIEDYKLGKLLQNEQLGPLNLDINSKGTGATINEMDADLAFHLNALKLNGYTINDFSIDGNLDNGKGHILSSYKDKNINLAMDAMVLLDSIAPQAELKIDLIGADLRALGFSNEDLRTGLKLQLNYEGKTNGFDVETKIDDGIFVYNNKSYLLGDFTADAHVRNDSTAVSIHNKILDLRLNSNTDPGNFASALEHHLASHFNVDKAYNKIDENPVHLKLDGELRFDPLLKEVFLIEMEEMKTIKLAVDFNEKAERFNAAVYAPLVNYGGNRIDSLVFDINTNNDVLVFHLGFDEINAGPISIERTILTGNQKANHTNLEFLSYDDDEKLMHVQSNITTNKDELKLHILPETLLLNKTPWEIPADNEMIYTSDQLVFNAFKINRNQQSVAITDKLNTQENPHIALVYNNFNLNKILTYLNPDQQFAEGIIDGEFIIENPFTEAGILADLSISNFKVMDVGIGTLNLDAKSIGKTKYSMDLSTKEGAIELDLSGDYIATIDDAELNLNLAISKLEMAAIQNFSQGELSKAKGRIEGDFSINGLTSALNYQGELRFKNAQFEVVKLNAPFALENEVLKVDNAGIRLEDFTLKDKNNNTLIVAGTIGTENMSNPVFDLSIDVDDFQLLDASEKDNDFLYGTAIFDVESKLTGNLNLPKLSLKAEVNKATDLTYVMPSASVNIEERDGVVSFVNRKNPEAILTRSEEETATITGIDVDASIKVVDGAKVTILIDKETGDNFEVYGAGDLKFRMNPNGKMSLVGFYEVSGGHYEMNLYNIVDRKFELVNGSRISWSGDVLDAKLDIKTLYNVETSAASLMAAKTSGADPSVKSKYRQVLPFQVYLNVNGAMLQPLISFQLDMPEDEQGAIGGQVYERIQQLNQQETELNKQVFALLVLNSFYPDPESDGSNGGAASIARENINDALSDQLNMFSDKLLGDTGVELDFGLDSYTDYQSQTPTERTQLDIAAQKKLLDDRLIVRVGSEVDIQGSSPNGEASPIIGNISLEYILTEDGRYRIKGFRKNQFDNVIDGQTIASGIGLIFTQEFNKFSELKDAILLKKKLRKEKALKEKNNNR